MAHEPVTLCSTLPLSLSLLSLSLSGLQLCCLGPIGLSLRCVRGGLTLQRRVACWSLHSPLFASDRPTLFGLHWPFHSDLVSSWRWLEHRSPRCLHRGGRGHSALLAYALGFWCFFGHGDSPDGGGLSGENLVFSACSSCAWSRSLARFCRQVRSDRRDTAAAAGRSRPWVLRPLGIRLDVTLSLSRIDSPAVCRCGAEVRLAAAMRGSCSTPAASQVSSPALTCKVLIGPRGKVVWAVRCRCGCDRIDPKPPMCKRGSLCTCVPSLPLLTIVLPILLLLPASRLVTVLGCKGCGIGCGPRRRCQLEPSADSLPLYPALEPVLAPTRSLAASGILHGSGGGASSVPSKPDSR